MVQLGISAAIYAKRRKLSVLVISKGEGALGKTQKIENYYGFAQAITGDQLYKNGISQAQNLGIELVQDEVVGLQYFENFEIETTNSQYQAKSVILATGTNRLTPKIKGIEEFEGKGVSYCAICDAFFFKGKDVVVLGNGNYAIHEMEQLKPVVNSVTILTNGEDMIENRGEEIEFTQKKIREFRGKEKIEEVEFEDNTVQEVHGVFVAIRNS